MIVHILSVNEIKNGCNHIDGGLLIGSKKKSNMIHIHIFLLKWGEAVKKM